MLLEVDRMKHSARISGLPRSKLSSRDAYLLKLSSKAAKKEESRRRSTQQKKAYKQVPIAHDQFLRPRNPKMNSSQNFGTRRYSSSWSPRNITRVKKKSKKNATHGQNGQSKRKKSNRRRDRSGLKSIVMHWLGRKILLLLLEYSFVIFLPLCSSFYF